VPHTRHCLSLRPLAVALALLGGCGLAVCAAAQGTPKPETQKRIRELRSRLKNIDKKTEQTRQQVRVLKRAQVRLSDQLNESYERLEKANAALRAAEDRLKQAEQAVAAGQRRLERAQERLKQQQQRFGRRVAASYREGAVTYTDVLAGSRSLADFLDRQYYVSRVMAQDADLLGDLRRAREQVAVEQARLVEWEGVLAMAHRENADRVMQAADQAAERQALLDRISQERALQEERLAEMEEDSEDIRQSLEGESARRRANPGGFRVLPRWSGRLFRPAAGPITSGFGYRFHPVLRYSRLHTGIDIGAPTGAPVYAAESGEVLHASWRGAYGRCIILLHGDGMSTLYGHLSEISVTAGQSVGRGQRIGAVGSTGLSTGPHLHFEVRRNGVPINPL
jgi:murein DD-endopeptidase MepM/ murein hydrolase activator NlpD